MDAFRDSSQPFKKRALAEIEEFVATAASCVIEFGERPLILPNFCPPKVRSPGYEQSTFFWSISVKDDNRDFVAGHAWHSEECLRMPIDAAGGK